MHTARTLENSWESALKYAKYNFIFMFIRRITIYVENAAAAADAVVVFVSRLDGSKELNDIDRRRRR